MVSLDSSVIIEVVNARSDELRHRFLDAREGGEAFVVSSVVLHEVVYGAQISQRPTYQRQAIEAVVEGLNVEPFTPGDAIEAAQVRAELKQLGQPIGGLDTLIAGQARARGWSVATANIKDFTRVPNLVVQDWTP